MLEEDKDFIIDCLFSINKIEEYTKEIYDLVSFESNSLVYDAVLTHFVVIGQSTNDMSEELKVANPHINWAKIKSFRNYIAHDYFGIDIANVWSVVKTNLPQLKEDLTKILNND